MLPRETIRKADCPHIAELKGEAQSDKTACEECGLPGPLRRCMTCGYVGCCESFGAHDTKHARATGHHFIRPHRCDYDWLWCYGCEAYLA
ncbi:MAG TPA: UBP-type zinc finger domain-containing protein [Thermoanaerobaculia bacterium]|nr:UBP-type zinc finger domain-containing protein [Thermoanaerobaculia bacterium]